MIEAIELKGGTSVVMLRTLRQVSSLKQHFFYKSRLQYAISERRCGVTRLMYRCNNYCSYDRLTVSAITRYPPLVTTLCFSLLYN